jgi:hypothetical protein
MMMEMDADAAVLDGWTASMSMFMGEGMVITPETVTDYGNMSGETATFTVDIPCNDTWHVWVRGHDGGNADSFFAQVDGEMDPPFIFELECTMMGSGMMNPYVWRELNQRDPMAMACEYVADPWTFDWTANSQHDIVFMPRESQAISAVTVTNDPAYMP